MEPDTGERDPRTYEDRDDAAANGPLRPDRIKSTYDKTVGRICPDDPEHPPYRMSPFTRIKRPVGCTLCRRRAAATPAGLEGRAA